MRCRELCKLAAVALAVCGLLACAEDRGPTPGYTGSWTRDFGQRGRSTVSIWQADDGTMRFCWTLQGPRSGAVVRCTPEGTTEEVIDGERRYLYTAVVEPGQGALDPMRVRIRGEAQVPGPTDIEWVDRLELSGDGLEMRSWQIELNGEPRPNPVGPLRFQKLSDKPFQDS